MHKPATRLRSLIGRGLAAVSLLLCLPACSHAGMKAMPVSPSELDAIEKEALAYVPDPRYPDDPAVLVTVLEGLKGVRERNGGVGACLVRKETGEVLERAHNSQYEPYFRSDRHAEMSLLEKYEDKIKLTRSTNPVDPTYRNPRKMQGMVLYTSLEPCPMCLTRIINSGISEVYYAAEDPEGGMATRFENLPPAWKRMAGSLKLAPAQCSPTLQRLAASLFRPVYAPGYMKSANR